MPGELVVLREEREREESDCVEEDGRCVRLMPELCPRGRRARAIHLVFIRKVCRPRFHTLAASRSLAALSWAGTWPSVACATCYSVRPERPSFARSLQGHSHGKTRRKIPRAPQRRPRPKATKIERRGRIPARIPSSLQAFESYYKESGVVPATSGTRSSRAASRAARRLPFRITGHHDDPGAASLAHTWRRPT